jgi:Zn-dependent metalloprotease
MYRIHRQSLWAAALLAPVALLGMGALLGHTPVALRPEQVAKVRSGQATQVQRVLENLNGRRAELGLGQTDGFQSRHAFTNAQGEVVTHLSQTFSGHRVWGAGAIAHVLPSGQIVTQTARVLRGVGLKGEPTLTAEQAKAIALHSFAAKGALATPATVERIVFPSARTGGIASRFDKQKGQLVIDRSFTVLAPPPSAPYVWAFEVKAAAFNPKDGQRAVSYIVDGNTGSILHKSNDLRALDVFPPPDAVAATGTGNGLFAGTVPVDVSVDSTGAYWYWDQTRGFSPNPYLLSQATNNGYTGPTTGLMVIYESHRPPADDAAGGPYPNPDNVTFQSPTATFGDGQRYMGRGNEGLPNGQTTGVDAHFAMSRNWDFFQGVFGMQGVDGTGGSTIIQSHVMGFDANGNPAPMDGAFFNTGLLTMYLGDGTYPSDPNGTLAYGEVDVVAHELTHGIIDVTSQLGGDSDLSEAPAIAEGVSDALGEAAEAFAYGPPVVDQFGTPLVPATGNDWGVATRVHQGTPLRYFKKPSTDGVSQDNWFEGLGMNDMHFANGPLNRAFYFLANGASADSSQDTYSPYLPGGMKGVGMDHAARIWFRMVTDYLGNDSDYADTRVAALTAANELFNVDSQEATAVMNAFAAINVGEAPGQSPRTQVTFPVRHSSGFIYDNYANFRVIPVFGRGTVVTLHADVKNNADQRLQWQAGTPFVGTRYQGGGVVDELGRWHTPMRMDWHGVTATSVADPLQYAVSGAFLLNMDTDDDGDNDAIDMGGIALSWGLGWTINAANSVFFEPFVIDDDIAFFHEMLNNAYAVTPPSAAN